MKRLLTFLACLLPTVAVAHPDPLETLLRLPKIRALWEEIAPIEIRLEPFGKDASYAMWLGDQRQIVLNTSVEPTFGTLLGSILFEMHNAKAHGEFITLDTLARKGEISCEEYVAACEWIEYQNGHQTAGLLSEGIALGLFPQEARFEIEGDFASYLETQEELGHTAQMRRIYDDLRN